MADSRALSQWEIDALLNQIPESTSSEEGSVESPQPPTAQSERAFTRVIKNYDFRRPDKFSKEQWHTLQSIHETFARLVGAAFSSRLRTLVTVRLSSIDQGLYEEWQSQVPSQTVVYVLSMQPLQGNIALEFSSDVAIEVIDRLLGGNAVLLDRGRDLGEIELTLLRSFSSALITSLDEMWSAVAPVKPELQDLGLDAGLIQIAGPNDVVISAFFEVNLGNHLGAMSICVPYTVLEPIASKLSTQLWHGSGGRPRRDARTRQMVEALLGSASVDLTVELGSVELPVRSVIEMREGDTLVLDARADRPLPMFVGEDLRLLSRPGVVGNRIAVRVTEVIERPQSDFGPDEEDDNVIDFPVIADPIGDETATPAPSTAAGVASSDQHEEAALA
jgi:flagellar motor switch protein FliM